MGVASTNRTDKFWHTGSAEEYSSEEFDSWGVCSYARVWRSYLQAVPNECYLWFHQCGDVINYVIPHYCTLILSLYGCGIRLEIWIIWSTTVLLHFDSVDFPSWKSGRFSDLSPKIDAKQIIIICSNEVGWRRILHASKLYNSRDLRCFVVYDLFIRNSLDRVPSICRFEFLD